MGEVVEGKGRQRLRGWLFATVVFGVLSVLAGAFVLVTQVVLASYWAPSGAMEPAIAMDSHLLARRGGGESVQRGDIVVVTLDSDVADTQVKRVAALGGETVDAVDGSLVVNGEVVDEPYLEPGLRTSQLAATTVPDGMAYLLADNRVGGRDSRVDGPVDVDQIRGVVVVAPAPNPSTVRVVAVVVFLAFILSLVAYLAAPEPQRSSARPGEP